MRGRGFLLVVGGLFGVYSFYSAVLKFGWFNLFVFLFIAAVLVFLSVAAFRVLGGGVNG